MIRIESVKPFLKYNTIQKPDIQQTPQVRNNTIASLSGVPRSYITFRAHESDNINITQDGISLIEKAQQIAKQQGCSEITPYHIIDAAIEETELNLSQLDDELLDSGVIESVSPLNVLANNYAKRNILLSEESREYFLQEVQILKEENNKYLNELPTKKSDDTNENKLDFSGELKEILKDVSSKGTSVNSYILLGAAFNAITTYGIEYPGDFLKGFMNLSYYKSGDDINQNYMRAYDSRAVEMWNKLALGSNLFVTYSDSKEADRLTASIGATINAQKHGDFNNKNTLLYVMSDNITAAELANEANEVIDAEPDKNKIFIIDFDTLLTKSLNTETNEIMYPAELITLISQPKENTRFVFLQHKDSNYQLMQNPILKKCFSDFISYSIPPIHAYEAQEILDKTRKYKDELRTPFSKDARHKAVAYADKIEGIYPDKAVDLMRRIADYYGSARKKINIKDVDEFAYVAKDIFNKSEEGTSVIYDTGKNLSSLYGKDTTKKDAEAIVRQIKTGRIGTRGYVMYSEDEEAGSGRRFTAQAIAGEAKVPFIEIASSDFALSALDDEGTRTMPGTEMKRIFSEAKKAAEQNEYKTAIIYVNNFEDFAFSGPYLAGYKQAMAQMVKEMEKAESENVSIVVIGSTDSYYADAILMAVRGFNQQIAIDSPAFNKNSRKEIILNRIKELELPLACRNLAEKNTLIDKLVKLTEYMSFVEIKSMIEKTGQIMLERGKNKASIGDFIEAYLQLTTGRTSRPEMPEYNRRATTSHECGHAVNLEVMNEILREKGRPWHQSRDVNFITLDPRGNFLGAVFEGKSENSDYPFEAMFTGLVCAYGGYSCEKMFFDMDGSSGISQDLAQASASAKRGIEYFGFGYNTGKISNAVNINSNKYAENVFKDMDVILTNAQIASDLITETYRKFNEWFTDKYSKLIGTDDCMIDGDAFRAALAKWKTSQPQNTKEEFDILGDMIMDIIKSSKQGKMYGKLRP